VCGFKSRSLLPILIKFYRNFVNEYKENILKNNIETIDEFEKNVILPKNFQLLTDIQDRKLFASFFLYLKNRGITENDLWKYKFGICQDEEYFKRLIIPSFDKNGKLNFFTSRNINPNAKIKYKMCEASKKDIIFNEIYLNWKKPIKICEGPFDMVKLGDNTTCLLGSELDEDSKLFQEILLQNPDVILCLDNDMRLKSQNIARTLSEYGIHVKVLDLDQEHDPGGMNREQLKEKLELSSEYSWNNLIKEKIKQKLL
jgi:hypothetical protein